MMFRSLHLILRRGAAPLLLLCLSISAAAAQSITCPAFVEAAINLVGTTCGELGRNELCYGNNSIDAEFTTAAQFDLPGDRANLTDLSRLVTAPLLPDENIWGVAVLSVQADLPDALPGQNARFIVFGATEITPTSADGYEAPMQAFNFTTELTGIDCDEMPESGLLVQAPTNTTVNFLINGIEVKVGSSAMLQMEADELVIDTIEGFVQVTSAGATEVAGEGLSVRARRGQRPTRAAINLARRIRRAPWRLLPRPVEVPLPPPDGQRVNLGECLYLSAERANQNPVRVTAGAPIVLRLSIPHQSLEIARVIQQSTRTRLLINGVDVPPYTRIGPWRGVEDEFRGHFGIEFYWLIEPSTVSEYNIMIETRTLTGRPINTGIDGPDPDSEPEIIPARRRVFCTARAG